MEVGGQPLPQGKEAPLTIL